MSDDQKKIKGIAEIVRVINSQKIIPLLKVKPIRTASGIAAIAVMCKPHGCPHIERDGHSCIYCPGGLDSDFEYSPQSYTRYEPTTIRAIRARYDAFVQTRMRMQQFERLGHSVEKIEFIVMGISGSGNSTSLSESVRLSEFSAKKCVGITIETRPDYCHENHIADMLSYGCTRLEIGIQTVYEDVVKYVNRGHTIADVIDCFRICKDAGYKIVAHLMPNLPSVSADRDIEGFRILAENPDFRQYGLKTYPTLVMRGTVLYDQWKQHLYRSYNPLFLIDILAKMIVYVTPWVRIYRIQRDIPMPLVTSGVESGNLREKVINRMHDYGLKCRDIRTRECLLEGVKGADDARLIQSQLIELLGTDILGEAGVESGYEQLFESYDVARSDPDQNELFEDYDMAGVEPGNKELFESYDMVGVDPDYSRSSSIFII
ncbi:MAG: putative Elongator complex protein 3 [Streblomastix strix]|uniref:Putative Elongator complex protein 3 n=1 Tax=Streblomastix strix TaxID=222440 RepID=A0A5J4W1J6_9EUKA|nr:MAG: putative Elongator complex protein 3 [Streblomastix strix]